jgi:hypothetical protein
MSKMERERERERERDREREREREGEWKIWKGGKKERRGKVEGRRGEGRRREGSLTFIASPMPRGCTNSFITSMHSEESEFK